MIEKDHNRYEYKFLTRMHKVSYVAIYKGEYQKLKVGDKILCIFEGEQIETYVDNLHYVLPSKNVIEGVLFDEDKYGKIHVYLNLELRSKDYSYFIEEYYAYKKLLEESKRVNFNILSLTIPEDISRTKIVLPCKVLNPLLMENVLSSMFNLPKRVLHNLMKQSLMIDTMDDEFVSRKIENNSDPIYLTGIEAIEYLYNKIESKHSLLKEEDIFINEIYVYPQYWERMYIEDGEENGISYAYRFLVNRCKYIVMLNHNEDVPKLVLENEKRMLYEKYAYLLERFIHAGLLIKRL